MPRLALALYELLLRAGVPDDRAENAARDFLLGFELRFHALERDVWILLALAAVNLLATGMLFYATFTR
jgi:hypothetical protein